VTFEDGLTTDTVVLCCCDRLVDCECVSTLVPVSPLVVSVTDKQNIYKQLMLQIYNNVVLCRRLC